MDMVPSPIQVKSSLNDNVQDQQLLTLHTISPLWAKRLEKSKLLPLLSLERLQLYLELRDASKCVVGEAYGFSSSYVCNFFLACDIKTIIEKPVKERESMSV